MKSIAYVVCDYSCSDSDSVILLAASFYSGVCYSGWRHKFYLAAFEKALLLSIS